ncbi:LysM peptidoglycan-binding domain-containing protein [Peribacillus sp. SCS-155]|uniref:LysM peptidoglycan-binding domain-containing protein n=1 Tax=Peribacillus sedimenti TaxID=3115297 RepID=UPI0039059254
MKKFSRILSVSALSISLAFSSAAITNPVQAAAATQTQKETLQYNQSDFYNYMAYDALLLKRMENVTDKFEKATKNITDVSPEYITANKVFLKDLQAIEKKYKSYTIKNKDFAGLKTITARSMKRITGLQSLTVQVLDTQDEKLALELDKQLKDFDRLMDKDDKDYTTLAQKIIKKYKIKRNAAINYAVYGDEGKTISPSVMSYIVKKGDSLASISKAFGVTASDLKKWNNLKANPKTGQKIKIQIK